MLIIVTKQWIDYSLSEAVSDFASCYMYTHAFDLGLQYEEAM